MARSSASVYADYLHRITEAVSIDLAETSGLFCHAFGMSGLIEEEHGRVNTHVPDDDLSDHHLRIMDVVPTVRGTREVWE